MRAEDGLKRTALLRAVDGTCGGAGRAVPGYAPPLRWSPRVGARLQGRGPRGVMQMKMTMEMKIKMKMQMSMTMKMNTKMEMEMEMGMEV